MKEVTITVVYHVKVHVTDDMDEGQIKHRFEENYCLDNFAIDLANESNKTDNCALCPSVRFELSELVLPFAGWIHPEVGLRKSDVQRMMTSPDRTERGPKVKEARILIGAAEMKQNRPGAIRMKLTNRAHAHARE